MSEAVVKLPMDGEFGAVADPVDAGGPASDAASEPTFPICAEPRSHLDAKAQLWRLLDDQLHGGPCEAVTGGIRVRVSDTETLMPDAVVDSGKPDPKSVFAETPLVVFEVTSPATRDDDYNLKRDMYARVPSITAIVIIDLENVNATLSVPLEDHRGGYQVMPKFNPTDTIEIPLKGAAVWLDLEPIFKRAGVWTGPAGADA